MQLTSLRAVRTARGLEGCSPLWDAADVKYKTKNVLWRTLICEPYPGKGLAIIPLHRATGRGFLASYIRARVLHFPSVTVTGKICLRLAYRIPREPMPLCVESLQLR